jgi:putative chitinase
MITLQQLTAITNQRNDILSPFLVPLNYTIGKFSIDTPARLPYFLAQICHESGCFRYTEELASGDAYDTRIDLGNTPEVDGDGAKYKGRGLIQLTGTTNYKKVSAYFGVDFFANPLLLKTPEWACKSAGWFWSTKGLNDVADKNDFLMTTYYVNGGANGLKSRVTYLIKSYKALGLDGLSVQMDNIFNTIANVIETPQDSRFKRILFTNFPDMDTLNNFKKSLQNL